MASKIVGEPDFHEDYPVQEMHGYDLYRCVSGNIELRSGNQIDLVLEDVALFRTMLDWRGASIVLRIQKLPQVIQDVYNDFQTRLSFTEYETVEFECKTPFTTLCWNFATLDLSLIHI